MTISNKHGIQQEVSEGMILFGKAKVGEHSIGNVKAPLALATLISRDLIVRTDQNFIRANLTSTISWSTIWSVYPVVDGDEGSGDKLSGDGYWGPGLMYAWQPWSGHYVSTPRGSSL